MSLLKQNLLGRVAFGFPKPLKCTDSFPHQLFDLSDLWWKDPSVVLSPDKSSQGWLESLKLSGAQCFLWSAWPSVFFLLLLLHCLSLFSLSSSFSSPCPSRCSMSSFLSVHGFKSIPAHGCLIPLPLPVESPATASLGVPYLDVIIKFTGSGHLSSCNRANLLHRFDFSVTSWNESSATSVVKLDIKLL